MLTRVLLTTDTVGGVWRYSLELAGGFASHGVQTVLVTLGPEPDLAQRAEAQTVPGLHLVVTELPLDWLAENAAQLEAAARALAKMAAQHRCASVHLHTPALVGGAAWPAPVVAVAHSCVGTWWRAVHGGAMPEDLAWRADAVARGIDAADAVVAPSRSFARALSAHYHPARPVHPVLNGRRARGALAPRQPHVLTAGRLWDAGKNVARLDAAAARAGLPVLAAGPVRGPHGERIALRHVRHLGTFDEAAMAVAYASAAIFVSAARYEPFGLAVLEAAQAGCALVLSPIPTFRELWDGAALFVDPEDTDALAYTLRDLARSPERCAALGGFARRRAASYTVESMVAGTLRLHNTVGASAPELVAL